MKIGILFPSIEDSKKKFKEIEKCFNVDNINIKVTHCSDEYKLVTPWCSIIAPLCKRNNICGYRFDYVITDELDKLPGEFIESIIRPRLSVDKFRKNKGRNNDIPTGSK